jgi:hypothetical protein
MKKFALLAGTIFFIFVIVSCGGGKYSDAVKVMEKYCDAMDSFSDDLNKATSAADAAKAINAFSDSIASIMPEMKDLEKKYPELKSQKEEDMPAELKPVMDRMQKEIMPKFMGAMGKMQQYMSDPVVQEAYKKMGETMSKMQ